MRIGAICRARRIDGARLSGQLDRAPDARRLSRPPCALAGDVRRAVDARWGDAADDPALRDGAFRSRFVRARTSRRGAAARPRHARAIARREYHDARCRRATPMSPSISGCARSKRIDAMIHCGAHGTLEWLPGKAVALSEDCAPRGGARRRAGDLSLHRQQSRRGGAGQAPHLGRRHRPSDAAARRTPARMARRRDRSAARRICRGAERSTAARARICRT